MLRNIIALGLTLTVLPSMSTAEVAKSLVTLKEGSSKNILMSKADKTKLTYQASGSDKRELILDRKSVQSIFFYTPVSFHEGLMAYNRGEFSVAKESFTKCKEDYSNFRSIPNNYSVTAEFYLLECLRREGDIKGLVEQLNSFRTDSVVNENYISQLEIYPFWEAVESKSWGKIIALAKQLKNKNLSGSQRAQVSYCYALALLKTEKTDDALMEFNKAIALSELKEADLIQNSAEQIMKVLLEKPEVAAALEKVKNKEKPAANQAYVNLLEASSLAKLWDAMSSQTRPLPAEFKALLAVDKP